MRNGRRTKGVSSIISTLIITAALLIILVVASFMATSILGLQMADSEFQQAQSSMLLLDSVIEDVSLRPSAGGYVQFNEREGGIGIATTTNSLSIYVTNGTAGTTTNGTDFVTYSPEPFNNLIQLVYSGGSHASAAVDPSTGYTSLRGDPNSIYVSLTQGLGYLRLEQDNGAKIKLDYDRVRIVSTGVIDNNGTNLIQMTFIHLLKGDITASSGTVNVMVQNNRTILDTTAIPIFESPSINITISRTTTPAQPPQTWPPQDWAPPEGAKRTKIVISDIQVSVSLR